MSSASIATLQSAPPIEKVKRVIRRGMNLKRRRTQNQYTGLDGATHYLVNTTIQSDMGMRVTRVDRGGNAITSETFCLLFPGALEELHKMMSEASSAPPPTPVKGVEPEVCEMTGAHKRRRTLA